MKCIECLANIRDRAIAENIQELVQEFVNKDDPVKVLLFGSYAKGSYTDNSDYDSYMYLKEAPIHP